MFTSTIDFKFLIKVMFLTFFSFGVLAKATNSNGFQNIDADYYSYSTSATNTIPEQSKFSSSGIFRLYGNYALENTDIIKFKVEYRDTYTTVTPKDFVINNVGAVGLIEPQFSDIGFRLTNLYWHNNLTEKTEIDIGFLDTTNYLDTYILGNPWAGFNNFIFSTGSGTLTMPDEGTLGVSIKHIFDNNYYALASIADANALSSRPFDNLIQGEFFKSIELGWVQSVDEFYTKNIHLLYWELDGGSRLSQQDSSGYNFSLAYQVQQFLPFIRAGISEGDASLLSRNITLGTGYFLNNSQNSTLGFAIGFGVPNKELFKRQLEHQTTTEVFLKTTVGPNLTLTPSLQYLRGLPFNSEENNALVIGLRINLTL